VADRNTNCRSPLADLLVQGLSDVFEVDGMEEENLTLVISELPSGRLGFSVKLVKGRLMVKLPRDDELHHGLEEDDELLELPVDNLLDPKMFGKKKDVTDDILAILYAKDIATPFQITVARENEEVVERCFAVTKFKSLYAASFRDVSFEDYTRALAQLACGVAAKHLLPQREVDTFLTNLEQGRKASEAIHEVAIRDWTSAETLGHLELCGIVNTVIRDDEMPLLQHAVTFLRALRFSLVRSEGYRSSKICREPKAWPGNNITYRGGVLPTEHLAFFSPGKNYRVPMVLRRLSMRAQHKTS